MPAQLGVVARWTDLESKNSYSVVYLHMNRATTLYASSHMGLWLASYSESAGSKDVPGHGNPEKRKQQGA